MRTRPAKRRHHILAKASAEPEHKVVVTWTLEEDSTIHSMVKEIGFKWHSISETMQGRSANAIRNRWHRLQKASELRKLAGVEDADGSGINKSGRSRKLDCLKSSYRCRKCGLPKKGHTCPMTWATEMEPTDTASESTTAGESDMELRGSSAESEHDMEEEYLEEEEEEEEQEMEAAPALLAQRSGSDACLVAGMPIDDALDSVLGPASAVPTPGPLCTQSNQQQQTERFSPDLSAQLIPAAEPEAPGLKKEASLVTQFLWSIGGADAPGLKREASLKNIFLSTSGGAGSPSPSVYLPTLSRLGSGNWVGRGVSGVSMDDLMDLTEEDIAAVAGSGLVAGQDFWSVDNELPVARLVSC